MHGRDRWIRAIPTPDLSEATVMFRTFTVILVVLFLTIEYALYSLDQFEGELSIGSFFSAVFQRNSNDR